MDKVNGFLYIPWKYSKARETKVPDPTPLTFRANVLSYAPWNRLHSAEMVPHLFMREVSFRVLTIL